MLYNFPIFSEMEHRVTFYICFSTKANKKCLPLFASVKFYNSQVFDKNSQYLYPRTVLFTPWFTIYHTIYVGNWTFHFLSGYVLYPVKIRECLKSEIARADVYRDSLLTFFGNSSFWVIIVWQQNKMTDDWQVYKSLFPWTTVRFSSMQFPA